MNTRVKVHGKTWNGTLHPDSIFPVSVDVYVKESIKSVKEWEDRWPPDKILSIKDMKEIDKHVEKIRIAFLTSNKAAELENRLHDLQNRIQDLLDTELEKHGLL